jgi:hypothetical protein
MGFGGETWGRKPLRTHRPKWDLIIMDLQEVGKNGLIWLKT